MRDYLVDDPASATSYVGRGGYGVKKRVITAGKCSIGALAAINSMPVK